MKLNRGVMRLYTNISMNKIVSILLFVLVLNILCANAKLSLTTDEYAHHIPAGVSYLSGDFSLNPASPPLGRLLSAIPLKIIGVVPPSTYHNGDIRAYSREFWHTNDWIFGIEHLAFWARFPFAIISAFFALSVFLWAYRLFGEKVASLSLIFYLCPDIMAHSSLANADILVSFFFFNTIMLFHDYLYRPKNWKLYVLGILVGLSFLSKYSAITLIPIMVLIAIFSRRVNLIKPRNTAIVVLIALFTIWAGYGFEMKPLLKDTPDPAKKAAMYEKFGILKFAQEVPVPLATFTSGITSMMFTRNKPYLSYLNGKWTEQGHWYYYIEAFLIKNTIPMLLCFFLGLWYIIRNKRCGIVESVLIIPIAFFFIATLGDKSNAGIRYFLPVYPFMFIIAAGWLSRLWTKKIVLAILIMFWHVFSVRSTYPNYLTYFNIPNGYKYLRDSNFDWGQGLIQLRDSIGDRKVFLNYHWAADPSMYGLNWEKYSGFNKSGLYAVSGHNDWAHMELNLKDNNIGGIFVYDVKFENSPP